jgi:4-amino-4-deoxy-L-arabinose transferase-like glycosyltransferase
MSSSVEAAVHRLRFWRREPRPWWSWAALGGVGLLALVLYTWALARNGMANSYYAAAVKSGSLSWKAFFFGSIDPGSFITVDKLPASLWVQELSARLFGFSSWSMLLPQALAGVASVLVLYRLVRRWQGEVAAFLAALALALTPVAVVMFRYNQPDALLTLLLLLAAWALWSALEKGANWKASTWRLALCGALVGFAFLTKMLEALVVLPVFGLVYLVCGRPALWRRLVQLVVGAVAFVVAAGWWVAIVELWPKASRPYIGGSTSNSVLELVFSRSGGFLSNSAGGPNFSGTPGLLRMFDAQLGGEIAWLIPLGLAGLVGGLRLTLRARRTNLDRAGYLIWGGWALLYLGIFSMATGVLHPYYTVAAAPALAALVGGGSVALWRLGRKHRWLAWMLPAAVAGTAVLSASLLGRTPGYAPGLATTVIVAGSLAALGLVLVIARLISTRAVALAVVAVSLVAVLGGPSAYALSTISKSVTGSFASAGPDSSSQAVLASRNGVGEGGASGDGGQPGTTASVSQALISYLEAHRGAAEYIVAVEGAQSGQSIILASGEPVMVMGGFSGSDPAPTLAEFKKMVAEGKVRYVLVGGGMASPGDGPSGYAVSSSSGGSATASATVLASLSPSPATAPNPPAQAGPANGSVPSGQAGPPGGGNGIDLRGIEQWVIQNGTAVDASEYGGSSADGTLYLLSATQTTS